MEKLKYSDLTQEQKKIITNGCGGKGMGLKPPQFFFNASCNHHDFYYWRGGTEEDRTIADIQFLDAMWKDTELADNIFGKLYNKTAALVYFSAVRLFGWHYFYYGTMKTTYNLPRVKKL